MCTLASLQFEFRGIVPKNSCVVRVKACLDLDYDRFHP